ncbi:hypothetical protein Ctob_001371 [Chrysochromulina tobinii]|uniref:Uncharacterized protein n=1 Tax=Chrysochromulina tobinii TaxID=1460289 RepID=A0A0M0J8U8_9EUKA|nr:hypothetical protein Ctob_001371 [Chrysochromulina tobinii]|eukprot:KOO22782.1 hypothetical protein Ctob_001371 [Chrysochromulina sp. CCMP291]
MLPFCTALVLSPPAAVARGHARQTSLQMLTGREVVQSFVAATEKGDAVAAAKLCTEDFLYKTHSATTESLAAAQDRLKTKVPVPSKVTSELHEENDGTFVREIVVKPEQRKRHVLVKKKKKIGDVMREDCLPELVAAQTEMCQMRDELEAYRRGDPTSRRAEAAERELRDLRAQLAAEIASSAEHFEARSKLSDEIAELRLQLEAEKKRSASLPSPGASPEEESVKQLKKSLNEAKEELEAAHRAIRAKEESLAQKKEGSLQAAKEHAELVAQHAALVTKGDELMRTVRLQRLAAKALGMLYVQRLSSLKRQLRRMTERSQAVEEMLEGAPVERARLVDENAKLKRDAASALAAVEPLRKSLTHANSEIRQQAMRLQQLHSTAERLESTRRVNAELRTTNEELLEHVRFLTRSLSESQSRADVIKVQLLDVQGNHARVLARRDTERRALEIQLAEVVSRVREHEKAFLGEQPLWLLKEIKDAAREAREPRRERSPRADLPPPLPPSTATAQTPSPRWGIALPTVHAAAMPVRPGPTREAAGTPRSRRQLARVKPPPIAGSMPPRQAEAANEAELGPVDELPTQA